MNQDQLSKIESALWLAQYFVDQQEPTNEAHPVDNEIVGEAWDAFFELLGELK
jgi:hypothetical protein